MASVPPRRRAAGPVCAALVVIALTTAAFAHAGVAQAPTKIVHFRAFSADGRVLVRVRGSLRGSCFSGSIGLPRPDAWRCIVGNELLDPCLESPRGGAAPLVCIAGVRAVRLRLTRPLPKKMANGPERWFFPWRLVLRGGDVCERFTGTAAGQVQGQGLVYGCRSGGTTTEPRRGRTWTVRYLRNGVDPSRVAKLAQLRLVPVVRAIG